jgi:hypothetical protein
MPEPIPRKPWFYRILGYLSLGTSLCRATTVGFFYTLHYPKEHDTVLNDGVVQKAQIQTADSLPRVLIVNLLTYVHVSIGDRKSCQGKWLKSGKMQIAFGNRKNMQSQIVVCYSRYFQS